MAQYGITTVQTNYTTVANGSVFATAATGASIDINSVWFYCDGNAAGGTVVTTVFGDVYDATGGAGAPGALLGETAASTVIALGQALGWVGINLASPVTISPSTYCAMRIVAAAGTPSMQLNYAPSGFGSYYRLGQSSAPNPFGTPDGSGSFGYTIYFDTNSVPVVATRNVAGWVTRSGGY